MSLKDPSLVARLCRYCGARLRGAHVDSRSELLRPPERQLRSVIARSPRRSRILTVILSVGATKLVGLSKWDIFQVSTNETGPANIHLVSCASTTSP